MVDMTALAATGLIQPGSLYAWRYRIATRPGIAAAAAAKQLTEGFRESRWRVRRVRRM